MVYGLWFRGYAWCLGVGEDGFEDQGARGRVLVPGLAEKLF